MTVIVRLKGGLGNQLFQYATTRSLALILNTDFKLDASNFDRDPLKKTSQSLYRHRQYSLNRFNISEDFATEEEIKSFTILERERRFVSKRISESFYLFLNKMLKALTHIPLYYFEKHHLFNENLFNLSGDVYLDGYWQSERYFIWIKKIIESEFKLKEPVGKRNASILKKIKSTNSVSLHIRRGDAIVGARQKDKMASCSLGYYGVSVEEIKRRIKKPTFFVFSDEVQWVKDNLHIDCPTHYIDHNINKDHLDLFLMSQCKHNIIANSTFSWWGAWLNPNPNKLIMVPKQWFNADFKELDSSDVVPQEWIKIDN